ncbi:GH1 family beta-glucosidase [Myxococcota bacterium]|nr:GH1 family beta-glucosidase [Myxococcota bacterium]
MSLTPPSAFPPGFAWGVATSALQVEGAAAEDGRGESTWDRFAATPGRVKGGDRPTVACDHYHRFPEDVALMAALGVDAYRFSLSWPRLFPTGGEARPLVAGLDFYDRLVDALLAAGITPWATLHHWDLPQPLQDAGGWPARSTVDAFLRLAEAATRRLGDRVRHWLTVNEPWVVAHLGYGAGVHAPGLTDPRAALAAAHHLLLAHGRAVPLVRAQVPGARVGIVLNATDVEPASPSAADAAAARLGDGHLLRWFADPLYGRGYPDDVCADLRERGLLPAGAPPWLRPGDLDDIATPTDLLGVNYYMRGVARSDRVPEADNLPRTVPLPPPDRCTDLGWEIHPPGLTRLLLRLHRDYAPRSLVVTENGAAYGEGPDGTGRVRDSRRVAYLREHLAACAEALAQGVPLHGYFHWSLLDNFEWAEGFSARFGLVHVDFETGQRRPKDSFHAYRRWIAAHRR